MVINGGSVSVGASMTSLGTLTIGVGSNLTINSGFTQSAGKSLVQGTLTVGANSSVVINGGTLQVDGGVVGSSGVTVSGASSKLVVNANQAFKSMMLSNGTAEIGLADNSSGYKVLTAGSLTLSGVGTVQLHHGGMMIDYGAGSPLAMVKAAIVAGYHGGDWGGAGISSSVAAAWPNDRAVGYAEASAVGSPATFMGAAVPDATVVLVRMTMKGDANLDGTVDFSDLVAVAQHYGQAGMEWSSGDFNYDGAVDFADLVAVAQHYGQALAVPAAVGGAADSGAAVSGVAGEFAGDWGRAQASVPEPGGMVVVWVAGIWLIARRGGRSTAHPTSFGRGGVVG